MHVAEPWPGSHKDAWHDCSLQVLCQATVRVRAAGACSGASWLGGFWPPQGAVAGVPAGFVIQVTIIRARTHAHTRMASSAQAP